MGTFHEANVWQPRKIIQTSDDTKTVTQMFTAAGGESLFNITEFTFVAGTGALEVYKNGIRLDYSEFAESITGTAFTLVTPASTGDVIIAKAFVGITGSVSVVTTDIYVNNYQDLRDYVGVQTTVIAKGRYTNGDGGESIFSKVSGAAPGTYVDDNVSIIVPTGGDGSAAWLKKKIDNIAADFSDLRAKMAAGDYNPGDIVYNKLVGKYFEISLGTDDNSVSGSGNSGGTVVSDGVTYQANMKYDGDVALEWFTPNFNGVDSDRLAVEAAIAECSIGQNVTASNPYLIGLDKRFLVEKAVGLNLGGSTLILNGSTPAPENMHFFVQPKTSTTETWSQTITEGIRVFNIANSAYTVGSKVVILLGTDPYDPAEEHWVKVCTVLANSGTTITVDYAPPYDISGTTHEIFLIVDEINNVEYKNFKLDYTHSLPDIAVGMKWAANVKFNNIESIKTRLTITAYESYNVEIDNIKRHVIKGGFSSHGRIVSGWQLENCKISNISQNGEDCGTMIFLESWCRNVNFDNVGIDNKNAGAASDVLITVTGGSYNVTFGDVEATTAVGQIIIDAPTQDADFKINNLSLNKFPKYLRTDRVDRFKDFEKSIECKGSKVIGRLDVSLQPSMTFDNAICRGVTANVWVYIASLTGVDSVLLLNLGGGGTDITSSLVANQWVKIPIASGYGSDYSFNSPDSLVKRFVVNTGATLTPNTKSICVVEYWPIIGADQYLFMPNVSA